MTPPRTDHAARALLVAALAAAAGASLAPWPPVWLGAGAAVALVAVPAGRPAALGFLLGLLVGSRAMATPGASLSRLSSPAGSAHVLEGIVRSADPPGRRGTPVLLDLRRLVGGDGTAGAPPGASLGTVRVLLGPGPTPVLAPGDRVRIPAHVASFPRARNPGSVDAADRWARRGVALRAEAPDPRGVEILERATTPAAAVARLRASAALGVRGLLAPEDAGLARAMALGDRGALTEADRLRFRDSGQAHVVAVSGLHVTLLLAAFLGLLARLGVPSRARSVAGIGLVLAYVPFAGAAPSAMRAGVGGILYLAASLLGREATGLGVLAAVTLGVLVAEPAVFYDVGFQLSFAAVLGILLLGTRLEAAFVPAGPRIPGLLERPRAPIRRTFAISLGAWLATAPLLLGHLGQVCPAGALVAVPVAPLGAALLATSFAAVLLAPVPGLGPLAGSLFSVVADATRGVLDAVVALEVGSRAVEPPDAGWHVLYAVSFLAAAVLPGRALAVGTLGQVTLLALALAPRPAAPPEHPRLVVLDVGRGQCVVLLLPDGRTAVIDAGSRDDPAVGTRTIVPALRALRADRVDGVILSRPGGERTAGLSALARALPCDRVVTGRAFPEPTLAPLAARGLNVRRVGADEVLLWGSWGSLRAFAVPSPRAPTSAPGGSARGSATDESSLALLLETPAGIRWLVAGDLGADAVASLLATRVALPVEGFLIAPAGRGSPGWERTVGAARARFLLASCGSRDLDPLPEGALATARWGALVVDLAPSGTRLLTPWAGPWRRPGYDPPTVVLPVAALPRAPELWIVPLGLLLFAFAAARPLRWLTPGGSAAAFLLGVGAWFSFQGAGLAALFAPFLVATLLGKLPGGPEHPARGARQVAANGLPAGLGVLIALLGRPDLGLPLFLGGLSCLGADTCATEIGIRYGGAPRSVLRGRPLTAGESGGVTLAGLAASVGGSMLAPGAYLGIAGMDAALLGSVAGAGVFGALLDSVLGATVQYRGRDPVTGRRTEATRISGTATERVSGLRWLDNDGVNLASGLAASLAALGLLALRSLR